MEQRHPLAYRRHVGRHRHAARGLHLGDESGAPAAVRPRPRHPGLEAGVNHLRAAPPLPLPPLAQIPRIDFDDASSGQPKGFSHCTHLRNGSVVGAACRQFAPPCPQDAGWRSQDPVNTADVVGVCSGDWVGGRIVDTVLIPKTLAPGAYVLGWRWDCEE